MNCRLVLRRIDIKTEVNNINMNVLMEIINQSFDEAVFPSGFNSSKVIPIQEVPKTIKSVEICGLKIDT
jgi:hypothetical protein